ncbi:hypothetical protein JCM5353_004673 [Sporobolomyces roseus]
MSTSSTPASPQPGHSPALSQDHITQSSGLLSDHELETSLGVAPSKDSLNSLSPPLKISQRPSSSCTECSRRKTKCDKRSPCGTCKKRGKADMCQVPTHVKKPTGKSTSQLTVLNQTTGPSTHLAEAAITELPSPPPSTAQPVIAAPLPSPLQAPGVDPSILHPLYNEIHHLRARVESLQARVNSLESMLSNGSHGIQASDPSVSMPTPRASPPQGYPFYPYPYPFPAHHWAPHQHFAFPPHLSAPYPPQVLDQSRPPPRSTQRPLPVPPTSTAHDSFEIAQPFLLPIPPPTIPSSTLSPSDPSTLHKRKRGGESSEEIGDEEQETIVRRRGSSSLEKLLSPVTQQGQGLHPPPVKITEGYWREGAEGEMGGNALRLRSDERFGN